MFANFTNELGLRPSFEAHASYITGVTANTCGYVVQLPPEQQCAFVKETADCHEMETYISYINWGFCNNIWGAFDWIFFIGWFFFLMLVLFVNVELVFVPSLMVLANACNMGEFLTGVTILSMGNGIADLVFSSQKHSGDTEMMVNQMYGTALFVTFGIGGYLTLVYPFTEAIDYFIWARISYVVTILAVLGILYNERVTLYEAIIGFILYAIFITYIAVAHCRNSAKLKAISDQDEALATPRRREMVTELRHRVSMPKLRGVRFFAAPTDLGPNAYMFGYYWLYLSIDPRTVYSELGFWRKILYIIMLPIKSVYMLAIPTTIYSRPVRGWCKLAFMINVFFVPPLWLLALQVTAWPIWVGALTFSIVLSIIVFFTSRTDRPPVYHVAVAGVAFSTAILIEYLAASESVSVVSIVFKLARMNRETMGITVLTWSNSFGDLIANLYIARSGFHRLAHAACVGGPILNILIGVALKFTLRSIYDKDMVIKVRSGTMAPVSIAFLLAGLTLTGLAVMWSNWQIRRSIGIWMIAMYALYLMFTALVEFERIHAYGTDHFDEQPYQI